MAIKESKNMENETGGRMYDLLRDVVHFSLVFSDITSSKNLKFGGNICGSAIIIRCRVCEKKVK